MPLYIFDGPVPGESTSHELESDDHAWGEAISLFGTLLNDADGKLPDNTEWRLKVRKDDEIVVVIDMKASRPAR